ncbi:MAG: GNAT family N-acetyltransferase [Treponema sp.]|jgi:GNAT superfamily N-acetyltransferase|nr:GNAT family N-acetyltransferase [Treponema sp.]
MQFELSEALIGDLLFSMENQVGSFLLDTQEGVIVGEEDDGFDSAEENEDRYISLPGWDSTDGFRLMEHFTAGLRNPALRNELTEALNRGRGVFRAFKDILSCYPETEKLWYNYKERGMRRDILRWYNGLREEWGLERIGGEPEETGDLVLEDFRFYPSGEAGREAAAALHRLCVDELRTYAATHYLGTAEMPAFLAAESSGDESWCFPGDRGLTAETGTGDFAGYIAAVMQNESLYIRTLEVLPQYRGLGIGEALLSRFIDEARQHGPGGKAPLQILIDLPSGSEGFSPVLFRNAFNPYMVRYCLKLLDRGSETD